MLIPFPHSLFLPLPSGWLVASANCMLVSQLTRSSKAHCISKHFIRAKLTVLRQETYLVPNFQSNGSSSGITFRNDRNYSLQLNDGATSMEGQVTGVVLLQVYGLLPDYLDKDSFVSTAVKLGVEHSLPRSQVEPARR